jgi:hypothetical protein
MAEVAADETWHCVILLSVGIRVASPLDVALFVFIVARGTGLATLGALEVATVVRGVPTLGAAVRRRLRGRSSTLLEGVEVPPCPGHD